MIYEQQSIVTSLRQLADFLETKEFTLSGGIGFSNPELYLFTDGESFLKNIQQLGGFTKEFTDYSAYAIKTFGKAKFVVHTSREKVCEKIEDGVEVIPAEPERIIPARPERIVPKYKYKCPESLLKGE